MLAAGMECNGQMQGASTGTKLQHMCPKSCSCDCTSDTPVCAANDTPANDTPANDKPATDSTSCIDDPDGHLTDYGGCSAMLAAGMVCDGQMQGAPTGTKLQHMCPKSCSCDCSSGIATCSAESNEKPVCEDDSSGTLAQAGLTCDKLVSMKKACDNDNKRATLCAQLFKSSDINCATDLQEYIRQPTKGNLMEQQWFSLALQAGVPASLAHACPQQCNTSSVLGDGCDVIVAGHLVHDLCPKACNKCDQAGVFVDKESSHMTATGCVTSAVPLYNIAYDPQYTYDKEKGLGKEALPPQPLLEDNLGNRHGQPKFSEGQGCPISKNICQCHESCATCHVYTSPGRLPTTDIFEFVNRGRNGSTSGVSKNHNHASINFHGHQLAPAGSTGANDCLTCPLYAAITPLADGHAKGRCTGIGQCSGLRTWSSTRVTASSYSSLSL